MRKTLHIITGPPGSGKSTMAARLNQESVDSGLSPIPVYDRDLGNLNEWEADRSQEVTVTVTAPKVMQKQRWIERAIAIGREPRLYTLFPSRMEAHTRAEQRDVRNDVRTFQWIEYWYDNYKRHQLETRT